jgi:hypothetical protein
LVRGIGRDVNLGIDWCRIAGGFLGEPKPRGVAVPLPLDAPAMESRILALKWARRGSAVDMDLDDIDFWMR